jgi:putative membrane protein
MGRSIGTVAGVAGAATTAGMIAFPLLRRGSGARAAVSTVVVGGLATTTGARAVARWGGSRTALAASLVAAGTGVVERVGTATGWPFGRYRYTGRLRPEVGGVPAVVPAAWWAMALPAREVASAVLGPRSSRLGRVVVGTVALTAWDLFLDPQMTTERYWRWARVGRYRGIPASNFLGWLVTGAAVMAVLDVVVPPGPPEPALVAEYAGMAVMETVGFVAFFGDRLVAAVGGAVMLPLAGAAVARLLDG